MSAIDWSLFSTEDVLQSLRLAPKIAGAWEDCNRVGGVTLTQKGMWCRRCLYPGPNWYLIVFVQYSGDSWTWSIPKNSTQSVGFQGSLEEAKADADRALRELGWRLLD